MTEAGKKWAVEIYPGDLRRKSIPDMAEFWLRAFCDSVLTRAAALKDQGSIVRHGSKADCGQAFDELRRELLGEK